MNEILVTVKTSPVTISETTNTTLTQRHESHLEMEESTHKELESVPYEWSQKPLIEVMG